MVPSLMDQLMIQQHGFVLMKVTVSYVIEANKALVAVIILDIRST